MGVKRYLIILNMQIKSSIRWKVEADGKIVPVDEISACVEEDDVAACRESNVCEVYSCERDRIGCDYK
jgi:hypothetical protein